MEIWIGRNGERHGPYKEEDVRAWLRSGQVSGSDLAWREGLADWQPLSVLFPDAMPDTAYTTGSTYPPPAASMPGLPQTTAAALEDYAGFWKRVAAYILDIIVLWIPTMLIEAVFGIGAAKDVLKQAALNASGDPHAMMAAQVQFYTTMWPAFLASFVLAWWYYALCESSPWQATVGKLALGIRVTDMQGRRLTLGRALIRYPAMLLSQLILFVGFIMVAFTQRKQGLHDLIASTLVLNGRASEFKDASSKATGNSGSFNA
ncbi:RDD family protein [Rhodanobacter sp. 7MK24]|uniref:RDD family protein n=1 Tax=Rhodanobacter sp. 7MK24 TaxID=2775922 RepID=UPI00177C8E87|nr:RDD family protein [Rhodanobacter sp. 7MK24]MBD8882183.1 RDD family protein [Rhodanobacter sp. 7MK24]